MRRLRHRMGLDTESEQTHALDLAARAYEDAVGAADREDARTFDFQVGYLTAIADLAEAEKATVLEDQVNGMLVRLQRLWFEIS